MMCRMMISAFMAVSYALSVACTSHEEEDGAVGEPLAYVSNAGVMKAG